MTKQAPRFSRWTVALLLLVLLLPEMPAGVAALAGVSGVVPAAPHAAGGTALSSSAPSLPVAPAKETSPVSTPTTRPTQSPTATTATPSTPSLPVGPCAPNSPSAIDFAGNVTVDFSLFSSLQEVPYVNSVSSYANALQIDVYTGANGNTPVPIQQAEITVWAVGWNNQSLNSTLPTAPAVFSMQVDKNNAFHAFGQLNDFKFFPPGSTVYFNISIIQNVTDPSNWTSPCVAGAFNAPWNAPPANKPEPTWAYRTTNGWPSPVFENDIVMTATPNVFGGVQPDPFQTVYFMLNSSKIGMNIGGPEGGARLYYWLENRTGLHPGGASFCGDNSTYEITCYAGITAGVGPFYEAGDIIHFEFEAFVSSTVGVYNKIWSRTYSYVVGNGGTWCQPDSGYNFYGWSGSALPPYHTPLQQNGNYSGQSNPVTLTLNGPVTEIAVYNALGSAFVPALSMATVADASQINAPHPGIELAQPTVAATTTPSVAGATTVTFSETGLPAGSIWSVLLGTTNLSSPTSTINFPNVAPGSYAYTVTSPLGEFRQTFVRYVASPLAGTVTVASSPVNQVVNFTTQVYMDIIQSPWNAGNITTNPTAYGVNSGWYDNNTQVTLSAIGYFGFPFFLILTAGHSMPYPMQYVVSSDTNNSVIPAFQGILNLTVSSRNVTTAIAYAYVFFNESYNGQALSGAVLMNEANSTVFYTGDGSQLNDPSDLGPFPGGVNVTFYVLAYDELGCPLRSLTYRFHTVQQDITTVNSRTYFYVVVYDQGKGEYIPNVPVNMSNNTWWDICYTNVFGFCYPNESYSTSPLYLNYGWYNITVKYNGQEQSVSYYLSPTSNKTLTFIFNSARTVAPIYSAPAQGFSSTPPFMPLSLFFGMVLAGAVCIPIFLIFVEQRRRAQAEEKRITL